MVYGVAWAELEEFDASQDVGPAGMKNCCRDGAEVVEEEVEVVVVVVVDGGW